MPNSPGSKDTFGALAAMSLLGQLGLVIAVPMVAGVLAGRWLDAWAGTGALFTLGLLLLGVAGGLVGAWSILKREINRPGSGPES